MARYLLIERKDHESLICEDSRETQPVQKITPSSSDWRSLFVQNQLGITLYQWDCIGNILESKVYDQHLVKNAGTGILTLTKPQFVPHYKPHFQEGPMQRFENSSPMDH